MKGSFTVEATLNFSCVIVCLVFILYMGMYLHDKTVLEGIAAYAAQAGRLYIMESQMTGEGGIDWERFEEKGLLWRLTGEIDESELEEYTESLSKNRLLVCETPEITVHSGVDQITVSYHANTLLKKIYLAGVGIGIDEISGSVTDFGIESEEFVRLVKAIVEER